MKRIKLVYWDGINFGDALSPYLIQKLSGKRIIHKQRYGIKYVLRSLSHFKYPRAALLPFEKNIIGIGSMISYGNSRSLIWGSGFMNGYEPFYGGKVLAVRGKYTNQKLIDMGYNGCSIFGDPALLLPLLIKPTLVKDAELGIIPHWKETDYFIKKYGSQYKVIDLRTKDVEKVVREITSCSCILSTSLHGIIVSHAYGIPALWIKYGDINTDGIKFNDYFSSVNILPYEGFKDIDRLLLSSIDIKKLFDENTGRSLPQTDIRKIQEQLLKVAPFKVQNTFI